MRTATGAAIDDGINAHVNTGQPVAMAQVGTGTLTTMTLAGAAVGGGAGARDGAGVAVVWAWRRGVLVVALVAALTVHSSGVSRVGRMAAGAAIGGVVTAASRGSPGGVVRMFNVIDRSQIDPADAAVIVIRRHGLSGLEALTARIGTGVGLDILQSVGHALKRYCR